MTDALFVSPELALELTTIDRMDGEAYSPFGSCPVVVFDLADPAAIPAAQRLKQHAQAVILGVHRSGVRALEDAEPFDVLLTTDSDAGAPWVHVAPERIDAHVAQLKRSVGQSPMAAAMLCRVLRINATLSFADAVTVESLAYSTLLSGAEFLRWQARVSPVPGKSGPLPVRVERSGDCVTIILAEPSRRNAMSAAMRDALFDALSAALDDPSRPYVYLRAEGRAFSTGGALDEFGKATDLAQAHVIRTLRSCAALLDALGDRAHVLLNGACIGAGLEVPAAAANRVATRDAWFQLPELKMGLIPGAGGTVGVARAIGRHRCCHMVLSGRRIDAQTALDWGLVQSLVAA